MRTIKACVRWIILIFYILFLCIAKRQHPHVFLRLNKPFKCGGSFAQKTKIYDMCDYKNVPLTLLLKNDTIDDTVKNFVAKNCVLQDYIPSAKEFGVFFLGGKVNGVGEKIRIKKSKHTKPSQTIYANSPDILTKNVISYLEKILQLLPNDYGRFDILITNEKLFREAATNFYIAEINYGIDTLPVHAIDHRRGFLHQLLEHKKCIKTAFDLSLKKEDSNEKIKNYLKEYLIYSKNLASKKY